MPRPAPAFALILLTLAAFGGLARAEEPRAVRIAAEGARPPYNTLDAKGELAGFEIDLGKAMCAAAKLSCAFVSQEWDQMLPGLEARAYDAVMSAMEPTDERRAHAIFGAPYVRMPLAFLAARGRKPWAVDPTSLAGKAIGVEDGSPAMAWLQDRYKQAEIRPYASLEEAILDLAEGRVELVLGSKDALTEFLDKRREAQCCRLVADAPRDPDYLGEGYAMAFRKGDEALRATFDAALKQVLADGTYETIRKKYFAYPIY
jgi:polar amino acid transport system substrate-binding protein